MLSVGAILGSLLGALLAPEVWLVGIAIGFYATRIASIFLASVVFAIILQLFISWINNDLVGAFSFNWLFFIAKFFAILLVAFGTKFVRDRRSKTEEPNVAIIEQERKDGGQP